jgi:hypothetical protein
MAGDHYEPDVAIADQVRTSLVLTAAFTGLLSGTMTRLSTTPSASNNSNPAMFLREPIRRTVRRNH